MSPQRMFASAPKVTLACRALKMRALSATSSASMCAADGTHTSEEARAAVVRERALPSMSASSRGSREIAMRTSCSSCQSSEARAESSCGSSSAPNWSSLGTAALARAARAVGGASWS